MEILIIRDFVCEIGIGFFKILKIIQFFLCFFFFFFLGGGGIFDKGDLICVSIYVDDGFINW